MSEARMVSKETPLMFGPNGSLLGIITTPADGSLEPVACLMLNMGANHHIGPRRINVKMARYLADMGISSIRFDLAGLGDSGAPTSSEHFLTQAVNDMQAAMNVIQTTLGIRRFIVLGLCSGSTNAMALAVADPRVIGILMFDSFAFPGRRSRIERSVRRALAAPTNPAVWGKTARWIKRHLSTEAKVAAAAHIFDPDPIEVQEALFRRSMMQLAERDVAVLFLYSGTIHVVDRHRDQLGAFADEPFMQHVDYTFIGDMDHSMTSMASQKKFIETVCGWTGRVVEASNQPCGTPSSGESSDTPASSQAQGKRRSAAADLAIAFALAFAASRAPMAARIQATPDAGTGATISVCADEGSSCIGPLPL